MNTVTYSEYEHYSPMFDAVMVRVSVASPEGREYWRLVPADGKGYRDRRNEAIELCLEAIRLGLNPGEVRTR